MCFFTSLSANAAAVAKKYGKQLDIIEAARQILAEQEQEERARQEAGPEHKVSVYDIRLAEDIYVIPAYAEPQCVIVSIRWNCSGINVRAAYPASCNGG